MCVCVRERERETDRQTDRQTDRDRERLKGSEHREIMYYYSAAVYNSKCCIFSDFRSNITSHRA